MLLGYCERLETTPNDILGYSDNEVLPELKIELSKMDEEQQRKILEIVKILSKQ